MLTNAAGHTIHGLGDVNAKLVNAGTVKADASNNSLFLRNENKTNTGLMTAVASGWLTVDGVRIENAGGQIVADGGFVGIENGATIHGGTLSSQGGGAVYTLGNGALESLTSQAAVNVRGGDTLTIVGPTFANQGTLTVNHNQAAAQTVVKCQGDVTMQGNGNLWLYATSPFAQLQTAPGATLTNASGHTIHGLGDIRAQLVNYGGVKADVANNQLFLRGSDKTNRGLMKSIASAWLTLDGVYVDYRWSEIRAEGGNVLVTNGARVWGGPLGSTGLGSVYTSGVARLEGVTTQGVMRITAGDSVSIAGGALVNKGTIYVNYNQSVAPTSMTFDGDVTLQGPGDVFIYATSPWARLGTRPGSVLRNQSGSTIHGLGDVTGHVINSGFVSADIANNVLNVTDPGFVNLGTVEAKSGGWLMVQNPAGNFASGTLSAGTWKSFANSTLWLNGASIVTNQANLVLDGVNARVIKDGAGTDALAALAKNEASGSFTIRNGRSFTTSGGFENAGLLSIDKSGVFQVGNVGQPFTQPATGRLSIDIGGRLAGEFGQVRVAGAATLGGVISTDFVSGFVPVLGDTFMLMTYGSRIGSFDHYEGPIANGLRLVPTVYSNRVVLTALPPTVAVDDPPSADVKTLSLVGRIGSGGATRLELGLPVAEQVRLELFDLQGRRMAVLCDESRAAGVHWFGLDRSAATGRVLASGMYFARASVTVGGRTDVRTARVVIVR